MSAIPIEFKDILEKKGFAHVATIGPDGRPQNNPVWYDWDGSRLVFSQTTTRQKLHNVKRNPNVAISITDPDNDYRRIEIRGRVAEIVEDEDKAFINAMAKKYIDQDAYPWDGPNDHRVVVKVDPEHVTTMG